MKIDGPFCPTLRLVMLTFECYDGRIEMWAHGAVKSTKVIEATVPTGLSLEMMAYECGRLTAQLFNDFGTKPE